MTVAFLVLAAALQDPVLLRYGADAKDPLPVSFEYTLTLDIKGTDTLLTMIRSAEAFFSFQKIRVRGDARRRLAIAGKDGVRHHLEMDTARVDGVYDDEPYEFDFEKAQPPPDLMKDKLKQICWHLSISGREFTLTPAGSCRSSDANQDAWGEAMDLATLAIVRLPEKKVASGEAWAADWTGERKQKDNDGRFKFAQKAKLEKTDRGRARISFETRGTLDVPLKRRDPNAKTYEHSFEASGWIDLDLATGRVHASESKGRIRARATFVDGDGGDDHEFDILNTVSGKITPR